MYAQHVGKEILFFDIEISYGKPERFLKEEPDIQELYQRNKDVKALLYA